MPINVDPFNASITDDKHLTPDERLLRAAVDSILDKFKEDMASRHPSEHLEAHTYSMRSDIWFILCSMLWKMPAEGPPAEPMDLGTEDENI